MMMKLMQVAFLFAGGLSIAGCQMDGAKTAVSYTHLTLPTILRV